MIIKFNIIAIFLLTFQYIYQLFISNHKTDNFPHFKYFLRKF